MLVALATYALAASLRADAPPTEFLELGEGRIAYDVAGEGPLVVMLPGLGDLRQEYRFLAPLLERARETGPANATPPAKRAARKTSRKKPAA